MARRPGHLEHLLRRGLLILLVALAVAVLWLWLGHGSARRETFNRVYEVSVAQAAGNFTLATALGVPLRASRQAAKYEFYHEAGRGHVRFAFPLVGSRGAAVIEGEAVQIGRNWLIVKLVARLGSHGVVVDLSPNVHT